MIKIKPSPNADTRTCDFTKVTKEELLESSKMHKTDVLNVMLWLGKELETLGIDHDFDKLSGIDLFHKEFVEGFKTFQWYSNHVKVNKHHLDNHVPDDVNLLHVIEMLVDISAANLARRGTKKLAAPVKISAKVLQKAVDNTLKLIQNNIELEK